LLHRPLPGAGAAAFAKEELKAKTAACLIEVTEDYSVGLASFLSAVFTKKRRENSFKAELSEG
jgi:amino acid/amide ABC transporter substrate-binding protein, HAAT family (TC 3.A.1.4.-)